MHLHNTDAVWTPPHATWTTAATATSTLRPWSAPGRVVPSRLVQSRGRESEVGESEVGEGEGGEGEGGG